MRDAAIQRAITVVQRKVRRIEPMPFGVNYRHTDTCLLRFLFNRVELQALEEGCSSMHPPRKKERPPLIEGP